MDSIESELASLRPQAALAKIGDHFRAASGTLHVAGRDGTLRLVASFGIPTALQPAIQSIPIGKGIAGAAAERREAVTICNLQSDNCGVARPGAKSTGVEGAIAVPILDGDTLVGVLGIGKPKEHTYSPDEIALLIRLGSLLIDDLRRL